MYDATLAADMVISAYPLQQIKTAPNYRAAIGGVLRDDHAAHVLSHYRRAPQLV
jgi:hypothetical protein